MHDIWNDAAQKNMLSFSTDAFYERDYYKKFKHVRCLFLLSLFADS